MSLLVANVLLYVLPLIYDVVHLADLCTVYVTVYVTTVTISY